MDEEQLYQLSQTLIDQGFHIENPEEAIYHAMEQVECHDGIWFGSFLGGTFYADFDRAYWLEDTSMFEAKSIISRELGFDITENLPVY